MDRYTLPKDTEITYEVLNKVIEFNEQYNKRYNRLSNYYLGLQDINYRTKDDRLKNNKVMINHAKYITDMSVGYLLGNPVDYQVNDEFDISAIINAYKKQTINDLDVEIAKNTSIYGLQYEYVYIDENAEPKSCKINNQNAIIVYDDTVEHTKLFGLIYRPIYEGKVLSHYDIIYCDKSKIVNYKSINKTLSKIGKEEYHSFSDVPMICYRNNEECIGDFEPVISLIDAYNILQSDRVNDKEQLVDAILCMYGMDFDYEQAEMLKESRMLANIPTDGRVEYLVKTLQEGDVDILRLNIENDIHKISMVPNMSDNNFVGNASGVAIKYKLLAFEQSIKNKERYFEKSLIERFKLYNNYLVTLSKMEDIPKEEVDVVFKRNLPSNDFETSQMINNLSDFIDSETLISQLSFIKDASDIVAAKERESNQNYNSMYSSNEIVDINNMQEVTTSDEENEQVLG